MSDQRIVHGFCTWWDSIQKAGRKGNLPACPHCGSVLFEMANEVEWFKGVDRYEREGHPGYRKFVEWLRGKCFKNYDIAMEAYNKAIQPTG